MVTADEDPEGDSASMEEVAINWGVVLEYQGWEARVRERERWSEWHETAMADTFEALINTLLEGCPPRSARAWCSGTFKHRAERLKRTKPEVVQLEEELAEALESLIREPVRDSLYDVIRALFSARAKLTRRQVRTIVKIRHYLKSVGPNEVTAKVTWKLFRDLRLAWQKIDD
ncbi:MAG: hypothetical protein R3F30_09000 [Planctomycetota bacterium]